MVLLAAGGNNTALVAVKNLSSYEDYRNLMTKILTEYDGVVQYSSTCFKCDVDIRMADQILCLQHLHLMGKVQ